MLLNRKIIINNNYQSIVFCPENIFERVSLTRAHVHHLFWLAIEKERKKKWIYLFFTKWVHESLNWHCMTMKYAIDFFFFFYAVLLFLLPLSPSLILVLGRSFSKRWRKSTNSATSRCDNSSSGSQSSRISSLVRRSPRRTQTSSGSRSTSSRYLANISKTVSSRANFVIHKINLH